MVMQRGEHDYEDLLNYLSSIRKGRKRPASPEEELQQLLQDNPDVDPEIFQWGDMAPEKKIKHLKSYLSSDEETRKKGPYGYGWQIFGGLGPPRLSR